MKYIGLLPIGAAILALLIGYWLGLPADRVLWGILAGLCAVPVAVAMIAWIQRRQRGGRKA